VTERGWLLLPIETKARELDAKTFIACAAAEAGFSVLLGDQNNFLRRLSRLPRGFYLDKSIAPLKERSFRRLQKLGFRILAWCEEGLVYRNRDAYLHERVSASAFAMTEACFAWGEVQTADVKSVVNNTPARIFETGNPRFDLLREDLRELYRAEADALRGRFGAFILINTNFARYNHYFGRDKTMGILKTRGLVRDEKDEAFFRGWVDFLGQVFHSFEDMLPLLARAFPDRNIVLRPHPSENHATWRRIAAGIPNVHVIYEGGIIPWLLASELSIHNSCTTGVEGALMGRPALAYRKVQSETYDSFLPHRLSTNVGTFEELTSAVASVFAGNYRAPLQFDAAVRADATRYIASLDGPTATDRILSQICALPSASPANGSIGARLSDRTEQALRTIARTALAPFRATGGYAKQKFPGLSVQEVESLVHRYQALSGRFAGVTVQPDDSGNVILRSGGSV